ncbi:MAG: PepSY-associated TM helix domain-containing protein [Alcanivorax sp.]|uniref:PepSY-associated TM helix domain-containing protein n=1 Tax=Alcanivorax sp. TaxID=1872427 RepID=UPI003DA7474B
MRQFWVSVHRYAGLSMTVFLVIAGLTGSVLVFREELDAILNPELYQVSPPSREAELLDPLAIRRQLLDTYPQLHINWITLQPRPDHALNIRVQPPEENTDLDFDEVFVNPYTGEVLGTRMWGRISDGKENLIPFLYKLHYQLALGQFGTLLMGVIALIWTLDCFIGAYLTLPNRARATSRARSFSDKLKNQWRRWKPAWKVRWRRSSYKLNFDLHRAGGLWIWAMLFVLAWSSVAFNLGQVYRPAMGLAFEFQDVRRDFSPPEQPKTSPAISYAEARAVALNYLDGNEQHLTDQPVRQLDYTGMSYFPQFGVYHYRFRSERDVDEDWGRTRMYIDGNSGEVIALYLPTGAASGDTLTTWLITLHMAGVWGLPFKIFVSVSGILLVMLSVTGVVIWQRKRSARLRSGRRPTGGASKTKPSRA